MLFYDIHLITIENKVFFIMETILIKHDLSVYAFYSMYTYRAVTIF